MNTRRFFLIAVSLILIATLCVFWISSHRASAPVDIDARQLAQAVNAFWKDRAARGLILPPNITVGSLAASGYLPSAAVRSQGGAKAVIWMENWRSTNRHQTMIGTQVIYLAYCYSPPQPRLATIDPIRPMDPMLPLLLYPLT